MKCTNCSYESEQQFDCCPACGAEQTVTIAENPASKTVLRILKDTLFLVLCILISASCILSLAADSIPLLSILAAIFLWIAYAKSRQGIVDVGQLRCVSGTIYAQYVITNVLGILFMVIGVICFAAFDAIAENTAIWDAIAAEIGTDILPAAELTGSIFGVVFATIFILLGALVLVLNIFSMRYIHRFVKSLYQSVQKGVLALKHANAAKVWLFIFAGFSAFGALSSLIELDMLLLLSNGVGCAVYIIAGLLIRKYFTYQEETL